MENRDLERLRQVYPDATDEELREAHRRLNKYVQIVLDVAKYLETKNARQDDENM